MEHALSMKFLDATLKPVTYRDAFTSMLTALVMLALIGAITEAIGGDWRRAVMYVPGIFLGALAHSAGAGIQAPKALFTIAAVGAVIAGLIDLQRAALAT